MSHSVEVDHVHVPTPTPQDHPAWCSPEHCEAYDYTDGVVVHHESQPHLVRLYDAVLEVALWHSLTYGEPIDPEDAGPRLGPVVSLRRLQRDGEPRHDDAHMLISIFGARQLHRRLGELLNQYDAAQIPPPRQAEP